MVEKNFILYVNEKRNIRVVPLAITYENDVYNFKYKIPEKNLVCGMIIDGKPIKGDRLKLFPFKPVEKFLFEFSNIHFLIPEMEYNQENTEVSFSRTELPTIFAKVPFWGANPMYNLGESRTLTFSDEANNYFNTVLADNVFIHFSYDGINLLTLNFWDNSTQNTFPSFYYINVTNGSTVHTKIEEFFDVVIDDDITKLPPYVFISDTDGQETRIFPIEFPE